MNQVIVYESFSYDDTYELGRSLGLKAEPGDIYCLTGELAAGKTIFAKGFGNGLGVKKEITSPTFTIVNVYTGRIPFYHFDVYRIQSAVEMEDTGYEEYFFGDGVCLVEWAEIVADIIPQGAKWLTIEKEISKSEDYRKISMVQK